MGEQEVKKPIYVFFFGISMIALGLTFILITIMQSKKSLSDNRLKYIKDSLETEYHKKQLETYPFDHSEIKDTLKTK